jgi:hypothetical protein
MKRSIFLLLALSLGSWLGCSSDDDDDNNKGGSGGRAGKTAVEAKGGAGGTGGAGSCAKFDESCAKKSCCEEMVCLRESTGVATCADPCTKNSECDTGCCTDLKDTGDLVCASKAACDNPCGKEGESCEDETECCQGVCVINTTNPDYAGCRRFCKKSGDCESGCCRLFADSDQGFCTAARYCSCGKLNAKCGKNEPECCDPALTLCATIGESEEMSCRTKCKEDNDCASKCCSLPFQGEEYGVCYEGC